MFHCNDNSALNKEEANDTHDKHILNIGLQYGRYDINK